MNCKLWTAVILLYSGYIFCVFYYIVTNVLEGHAASIFSLAENTIS